MTAPSPAYLTSLDPALLSPYKRNTFTLQGTPGLLSFLNPFTSETREILLSLVVLFLFCGLSVKEKLKRIRRLLSQLLGTKCFPVLIQAWRPLHLRASNSDWFI